MKHAQEDPDAQNGDIVELSLPNDARAAGRARRTVRDTLTRWRLPSLIDGCVLAVSELVTNALRHGRPPIGMLVRRGAHDVRLDVQDADPHQAEGQRSGNAKDTAESGRGLDIVAALADATGCENIPGDGKSVYASWHLTREQSEPIDG